MIVVYKNGYYDLDMPFMLFQSTKENHPFTEVEIIERTGSTYKRQIQVEIRELEDQSIARNKSALGRN